MSTKFYVIAVWTLLSFVVKVNAQDKVECWDRFELSFKQVTKGNPFDTRLSATFVCGKEKKTVEGFYDGENTYIGYGLCLLSPGNGGMLHLPV